MATQASAIEAKFTADISDLSTKLDIITAKMSSVKTTTADMATGVIAGQAAFQILSQAVQAVGGFIDGAIKSSMDFQSVMGIVNNNIKNSGASISQTDEKLQKYSETTAKLGFTETDTARSVGQLMLVTKDYNKAITLNQLSMDVARQKHKSLAEATTMVMKASQGGTVALRTLGIEMAKGSSGAEILSAMQDKVKGSAEVYAKTLPGELQAVNAEWEASKKTIGDEFTPILKKFMDLITSNMPAITAAFQSIATNVANFASAVVNAITWIVNFYEKFKPLIDGIAVGVLGFLALTKAVGGLRQAWDDAKKAMLLFEANPIILVVALIAAGIVALSDKFGGLGNAMKVVGDTFKILGELGVAAFQMLGNVMIDHINKVLSAGNQVYNFFSGLLSKVGVNIGKANMKIDFKFDTKDTMKNIVGLTNDIDNMAASAQKAKDTSPVPDTVAGAGAGGTPDFDGIGKGAASTASKLATMKEEMNKFVSSIDDAAKAHKTASDKIQADIATTTKDYQQSQADEQNSFEDTVAKEIIAKQDEVKKLKTEIMQASAFGQSINEADLADKQHQLAVDQAFLNKHAADAQGAQTQINELNKDSIDQAKDALVKKQAEEKATYDKKITDFNTQLATENAAYDKSLANMADSFKGNWTDMISYIKTTATPNMVAAFDEMVKASNAKLAGVGLPGLNIPGVPKSTSSAASSISKSKVQGSAGSSGSSKNVSINFYGDMKLSTEADHKKLANTIRNVMASDNHLAAHGLY